MSKIPSQINPNAFNFKNVEKIKDPIVFAMKTFCTKHGCDFEASQRLVVTHQKQRIKTPTGRIAGLQNYLLRET